MYCQQTLGMPSTAKETDTLQLLRSLAMALLVSQIMIPFCFGDAIVIDIQTFAFKLTYMQLHMHGNCRFFLQISRKDMCKCL